MKSIKLIGRGSRLSILQMEIVREKIRALYPEMEVSILLKTSRGDSLQDVPLHTVEGSDFFTQDIFDSLKAEEADIAVHSLKDMSSDHFFGENRFAVVDRDDPRDIVIFRNDIVAKLQEARPIVIGTCSPRREEMATVFLKQALPQLGNFTIETSSIRGNVDTRLKKLDAGDYDGIILATAGLNRLLRSAKDKVSISKLLEDKKLMLLPLIECVPAPCQGAIVAECISSNKKAVEILEMINDPKAYNDCVAEKKKAMQYGKGCIQKFGVATIRTTSGEFIYSAGVDSRENPFSNWQNLPVLSLTEEQLFSSTDHMKAFFEYEWMNIDQPIPEPVVFIANHKLIRPGNDEKIKPKTVIAAGTRTWFELARQGYWVTACSDGIGFKFILSALEMPLFKIRQPDICVITNEDAAKRWLAKKIKAVPGYRQSGDVNPVLAGKIMKAEYIFWASFSQYLAYGKYAKTTAVHICAAGETATLLKEQELNPVIFPTIKSFESWRAIYTRQPSVA
jgi:hydroxymethylbilane synthase